MGLSFADFAVPSTPTNTKVAVENRVVTPFWGINPEMTTTSAPATNTAYPSLTPTNIPSNTAILAVNINTPTTTNLPLVSSNATTNLPPSPPVMVKATYNPSSIPTTASLSVNVYDPENRPLDVLFYGRPVQSVAGPDFTIVVIPDPQYYSLMYPAIFNAQTEWIANNRTSSNIVYVASLGDHVEHPLDPAQWMNADAALSILDASGIPYGLAAGNHEGAPSNTQNFNAYFGVTRFEGKPHYGGHFGGDNDNHFDLFSASGLNFIVIYIEYDDGMTTTRHPVLQWANGLLQTYHDRRAIVISHNLLQGESSNLFTPQGQTIYNALKDNPNLFLMMGGHLDVAARRTDTFNGNMVYTLRSDYQYVDNLQSGYLRILRFSPTDSMIYVSTYSPTQGKFYDKPDAAQSNFNLPYGMEGTAFELISTVSGVASGGMAAISWPNLGTNKQYQWFAVASDGTHQTASDTWEFTTTGVNVAPVAQEQTAITNEDSALPIILMATDANGDLPAYSVLTGPMHGSLTGIAPNLTYTPHLDYNGTDSFTFQASDGTVNSNAATISITINPMNDVPLCADVTLQTHSNVVGQADPLCTDKEGAALNYFVLDQPAYGAASVIGGKLQYVPQGSYSGSDSFTYKANDGAADGNVAVVNVTVSAGNAAPVAEDQSVTTSEDMALEIRLAGSDPDQNPLVYRIVSGPSHGSFDGSSYIPAANFNGYDSFTYQVSDGLLNSNIATATIAVNPVNDAPVSVTDAYRTKRNLTLDVPAPGVLANDQDIEDTRLTVTLVNGVSHGTLTLNTDGSFIYTPNSDFRGEDTFTYQISDSEGATSLTTVTINVRN
jgi:hypothetical protein